MGSLFVMLFLLKSRKTGLLMSNCFQYFSPGKLKTQVQQKKAGTALPLEEDREVAWGTERTQAGIERPIPEEKVQVTVCVGWINCV